jgi:hypothetical protein
MHTLNRSFIIGILVLNTWTTLLSQDLVLQNFSCDDFQIQYPSKFKHDEDDENQHSFFLNQETGELRISVYDSEDLSIDEIKHMLLKVNEHKEETPDIAITRKEDELICTYRYSDGEFVTFLKAVQNSRKMYFLSLYWQEETWQDYKEMMLLSFNSFQPRR